MSRIKVLAPLDCINDLEILYKNGANEVYCGYVPAYWIEAFNQSIGGNLDYYQVGINKRDVKVCNLETKEDLKYVIDFCEKHNMEVFLTVNAAFYPEIAYEILHQYLEEVCDIGVQNVIVSDNALMEYISTHFKQLKITVSCLSQIINSSAVKYYMRFSPRRVVFPRHITVTEMINIARKYPDIEFEYFLFSDKCIYDDGFCRCHHDLGTICLEPFNKEYYRINGGPMSENEIIELELADYCFRKWSNKPRANINEERTFFNLGCSACSLVDILSCPNINSIKIVGRGKKGEIKGKLISMACNVIHLAEREMDKNVIRSYMRECLPNNVEMCSTNLNCIIRGI